MQWLGVAWLSYLAWQIFSAQAQAVGATSGQKNRFDRSCRSAMGQPLRGGLLLELDLAERADLITEKTALSSHYVNPWKGGEQQARIATNVYLLDLTVYRANALLSDALTEPSMTLERLHHRPRRCHHARNSTTINVSPAKASVA